VILEVAFCGISNKKNVTMLCFNSKCRLVNISRIYFNFDMLG